MTTLRAEFSAASENTSYASPICHRLPPKDDSYRSTNVEPLTPVDIPRFLASLAAFSAVILGACS